MLSDQRGGPHAPCARRVEIVDPACARAARELTSCLRCLHSESSISPTQPHTNTWPIPGEAETAQRPATGDAVEPIDIAVVGAGYWGPNLVRNAMQCATTRLPAVWDGGL